MEIVLEVRANHHQVIPTYECRADSWEQANSAFEEGLELIRQKNQFYKEKNKGEFVVISWIVDFFLVDEEGKRSGQIGFSINSKQILIEEMIKWYLNMQDAVRKIG